MAHETIEVDRQLADPVTPEALAALLPRDEPRFVLLRYPHRYEDAEQCSTGVAVSTWAWVWAKSEQNT